MHSRLAELMEFAERSRQELLACVSDIPPGADTLRADDDGWSPVEVLTHLYLVEQGSVRMLFRAFRKAREAGLGAENESTSLLSMLDHLSLHESRTRLSAPDFTVPRDYGDIPGALDRLAESREGLRTWAREADGFALGSVRWPHPLLGELSLYGWVLMIGQHERRHAAQIRDIVRRVRR